MSIEAMKQALEALSYVMSHGVAVRQAKDILTAAIEQAEQDHTYGYAKELAETMFKQHFASDEHYASRRVVWSVNDTVIGILTQIDNMVSGMVRKPEQAEKQEPVAWYHTKKGRTEFTTNPTPDLIGTYWKPLYPRPPSKVWIGITDLEFKYIVCKNHNPHTQSAKRIRQTIKEIEDLLKERNT
jgi:hypothetical protein